MDRQEAIAKLEALGAKQNTENTWSHIPSR